MSEYDFEREAHSAWAADELVTGAPNTELALRRAYFAGQASGGGSDLDRLAVIAAAIISMPYAPDEEPWRFNKSDHVNSIAQFSANVLSALKAQAVKP